MSLFQNFFHFVEQGKDNSIFSSKSQESGDQSACHQPGQLGGVRRTVVLPGSLAQQPAGVCYGPDDFVLKKAIASSNQASGVGAPSDLPGANSRLVFSYEVDDHLWMM